MTTADLLRLAPFAVLGAALGALHFATLRHNVAAFLDGRAGRAIGLQLGRSALAGVVLAAIAQAGALPLLAALAGFMLARAWAVRS